MRHVSTLLPFVVFDSIKDCAFGNLKSISNITDHAMLETVHADIAKRFNDLATERWLEVKADMDKFAEPLYAAKSIEEFNEISQRPEFKNANAVSPVDQATYDKAAALVMTIIDEISTDLTDEEKEIDAVVMFSTLLKDISEGLADMIDDYSATISRTIALRLSKGKLVGLIERIFGVEEEEENATNDGVATAAGVPEQQQTTGQPEANTQGDLSARTREGHRGLATDASGLV